MSPERAHEDASAGLLWGLLDLWVVVVLVALTDVLLLLLAPGGLPTLTLLLVILFIFLLPGYALVSVLQPRRPRHRRSEGEDRNGPITGPEGGMALTERLVLAAVASVGIVATMGFALDALGIGITPEAAGVVLTATTLIGCLIATVRRSRLPPDSRFDGREVMRSLASLRALFVRRSTVDLAITSLIVVSVVVAIAGAAFIAVSAEDRGSHTELYLLTANGSGEPVAAEYPAGEEGSEALLIGIQNSERRSMNYTLVVQRQRVDGDVVVSSDERDRLGVDLPPDGEWRMEYQVPTGDDLAGERLLFLLYVDSAPDDPDRESAYRAVHVWLDAPAEAD